jgi:hypothetical protein
VAQHSPPVQQGPPVQQSCAFTERTGALSAENPTAAAARARAARSTFGFLMGIPNLDLLLNEFDESD